MTKKRMILNLTCTQGFESVRKTILTYFAPIRKLHFAALGTYNSAVAWKETSTSFQRIMSWRRYVSSLPIHKQWDCVSQLFSCPAALQRFRVMMDVPFVVFWAFG